jgi:hypothetical protein
VIERDRDRALRRLDLELRDGSPGRDFPDELLEILTEHGHRFPETSREDHAKRLSREVQLSDHRLDRAHELPRRIVDDALRFGVAEVRRLLDQRRERSDLLPGELAVDAVHQRLFVRNA